MAAEDHINAPTGDETAGICQPPPAPGSDGVEVHDTSETVPGKPGTLDEAVANYRRALALKPDDAELHDKLGSALLDQDELDEAVRHYIRALALKPDYAEGYYNLGNALSYRGHFDTAIAACRQAITLKPDYPRAHAALAHFKSHICAWDDTEAEAQRVLAAVRQHPGTIPPFALLSLPSTPAEQLLCARQRAQKLAAGKPSAFSHLRPTSQRKIRLGYFSADFREHAMAQLVVEMIERHDRSAFDLTAYSFGPEDDSDMRRRLVAAFSRFIDIRALDRTQAAQRIHADGIDILIDLTGYTRYGRTGILASRPAPIQVTLPGFTGTLGADFIDYLIADPFVAPMDHQPFYTERLVHLPHSYQPRDTRRKIAERTPTRAECGLPPDGLVFCCFNNTYKITPAFFDVWMRLLRAVPGSVLWLFEGNALAGDNLRREAAARDVAPERLIFAPSLILPVHLVRYRLADLFLDTLPYNAHTTGSDALWMGLPVLTCAGTTFAGRVGGSLLRTIGLPELITSSLDEYTELALRLAKAPDLLAELRARLARNRSVLPLFDIARYTRDIEAAYRQMWAIWCAGEEPRPFAVESA